MGGRAVAHAAPAGDAGAGQPFDLAGTIRSAQRNGQTAVQNNFEQLVELGRNGRHFDANDQHIVTVVDWLWQYAFEQRASDIHLEPRRDLGVVRFRIDGLLNNVYQVPPGVMSAMTSRIKLLGRMDVVEKRRPQDGRIKTRAGETRAGDGHEIELRLSTLPTAFGEKLVMRVFDPEVLSRNFAQLGLQGEDLARWQDMTGRPNGIVLVTGPTGSGKTTTLYATLRALATEAVNVSTIEDPIEMVENSFNQMQVQPAIDLGFADGIRALMRQDPDIIMVGEIRDLETAEMAVQAALTGAGRADGSPGDLHAAYQRRTQRHHATAGSGGAGVSAAVDAHRGDGAAAGAHAVSGVQAAR